MLLHYYYLRPLGIVFFWFVFFLKRMSGTVREGIRERGEEREFEGTRGREKNKEERSETKAGGQRL